MQENPFKAILWRQSSLLCLIANLPIGPNIAVQLTIFPREADCERLAKQRCQASLEKPNTTRIFVLCRGRWTGVHYCHGGG